MTRALITQMLEAMEPVSAYGLPGTKDVQQTKLQEAITAARTYLATEPSGERAELIAQIDALFTDITPLPWFGAADGRGVGLSASRWTKNGGFADVTKDSVLRYGGSPITNTHFLAKLANSWPTIRDMLEADAQQAKRVPDLKTGQYEPIPQSGADEVPPIFGRRWRLARDGFGLQRDDESGNYVQIDDAISTMHAILAASKEANRVMMTDSEAHQTLLDMAANIEKFGDGTESNEQLSSECIRFILERVDNHCITQADKPTDWSAA